MWQFREQLKKIMEPKAAKEHHSDTAPKDRTNSGKTCMGLCQSPKMISNPPEPLLVSLNNLCRFDITKKISRTTYSQLIIIVQGATSR